MPVYSRRNLRQSLGLSYLRDTIVAQVDASWATLLTPFHDSILADLSLSGQNMYDNATIRQSLFIFPFIPQSPSSYVEQDYRVASFHTGSGAFITQQILQANGAPSGDIFEVHTRLPAAEKDRAIDDTLKRIRVSQEVGINSGTGGAAYYPIDGAASPHRITNVLDAYYFSDPSNSVSRGLHRFEDVRIVTTATGREIRIRPTLGGSQQLVLDAILELTLPFYSDATVNLPDDRWLLAGAAAKCYDLLVQNAPGQNSDGLVQSRASWAAEFSRLSTRFAPDYSSKVRLNDPLE